MCQEKRMVTTLDDLTPSPCFKQGTFLMGYKTWHQNFRFCACSDGGKHPTEQTHTLGRKGSSETGKVWVTTEQWRRWRRLYSNTPESKWKVLFKIPYIILLPSACFQSSLSYQDCHMPWQGLEAKGCQAQQNLELSTSPKSQISPGYGREGNVLGGGGSVSVALRALNAGMACKAILEMEFLV